MTTTGEQHRAPRPGSAPHGHGLRLDRWNPDAEGDAAAWLRGRTDPEFRRWNTPLESETDLDGARVANANANPAHLLPLADLVVNGALTVPVRNAYPLADAAQAITDFADQHTVGKLVITM